MGCTSSAPNVSEIHESATDKVIYFSEDDGKKEIKENEGEEKKNENVLKRENVFPACNTKNDMQLDRNNSFNAEKNKDNHGIEKDNDQNIEQSTRQEKISTLKEVVEHVINNNVLEKKQSIEEIPFESNLSQVVDHETETQGQQILEESVPLTKQEEYNLRPDKEYRVHVDFSYFKFNDREEESSSPSQSDGSRATRWEALADMAAELPPSLTVDPITGQIYSLSK